MYLKSYLPIPMIWSPMNPRNGFYHLACDLQKRVSMKRVSMSMSIKSADDMENVGSLSHWCCFSEIITAFRPLIHQRQLYAVNVVFANQKTVIAAYTYITA